MNVTEVSFTSNFWNLWIIVLTVANILACWWLIRWTSKPRAGESAAGETTGHKWDGDLAEYNNPLPRWWLWLFYLTIWFSVIYLALYPGLGTFRGLLNWTQVDAYEQEVQSADEKYGPLFAKFAATPIAQLATDPDALKVGERLFVNYCAGCHGSDAGGVPGFPNLRDGDWLYGGEPDMILTSILDGRTGAMPGWEPILGEKGVDEVTAYVLTLSGREADATLASAGKTAFASYCAACHGEDGKGKKEMGAPNLTDSTWLYGGSPGVIRQSIMNGRSGKMPSHRDFLGEDKAHVLATYVYSLSLK